MLFLHERTVSSVTDVTVVLQLFLRIYVIKDYKNVSRVHTRKKVIKVLSQLSRRQCRVYLKQLRLNLIQGLKPAAKNLQLLPFVQTQQGVAVNAEHLTIGKCTQQSPFFTATYVVRLMPLRRATQIPLNRLWSIGMFFCSQAIKSPRPVWAFGVNDWSSVGSSFIFFMMFLLLKILQMTANPSQADGVPWRSRCRRQGSCGLL